MAHLSQLAVKRSVPDAPDRVIAERNSTPLSSCAASFAWHLPCTLVGVSTRRKHFLFSTIETYGRPASSRYGHWQPTRRLTMTADNEISKTLNTAFLTALLLTGRTEAAEMSLL